MNKGESTFPMFKSRRLETNPGNTQKPRESLTFQKEYTYIYKSATVIFLSRGFVISRGIVFVKVHYVKDTLHISFFYLLGLTCFRSFLADNTIAPFRCQDKSYVDRETNEFMDCFQNPKCQLPL